MPTTSESGQRQHRQTSLMSPVRMMEEISIEQSIYKTKQETNSIYRCSIPRLFMIIAASSVQSGTRPSPSLYLPFLSSILLRRPLRPTSQIRKLLSAIQLTNSIDIGVACHSFSCAAAGSGLGCTHVEGGLFLYQL